MMKTIRTAMVVLAMLAGVSTAAQAEPLAILHGRLGLGFEGDGFGFAGKSFSVFTLPSTSADFGPFFTDGSPAFRCDPCTAGSEFNPGFRTNDAFLGAGNATFGSTTYSNVSLFGTLNIIVTPLVFPSSTTDSVEVRTPFSFNGTVRGVKGNQQVFDAAFTGVGNVSRILDRLDDGRYVGGENSITFLFDSPAAAPVPEPATFMLFASGIGAVLARARARGKQPPRA
jgi:hypothetical protein